MRSQEVVSETYRDQARWAEMAIHNIASSGKFSSDRTISEYARYESRGIIVQVICECICLLKGNLGDGAKLRKAS